MIKKLLILFIVCFSVQQLISVDIDGFVDTYLAADLDSPNNYNSARIRARINTYQSFDQTSFFASFNAVDNELFEDESGIELHEMYIEHVADLWDLRVGKQLVIWGNADALRISDIVCPVNFSEFITQDFDDIRMPQNMIKIRYLPSFLNLEMIWLPNFNSNINPNEESVWCIQQRINDIEFIDPKTNFENSELFCRISMFRNGFDVIISAARTREDTPIISTTNNKTLAEYKRRNVFGTELSIPVSDLVFRFETAVSPERYCQKKNRQYDRSDYISALLGCDWNAGNSFNISIQYALDQIANYDSDFVDDEYSSLLTASISKKFLREIVEISNKTQYGINNEDGYNQIKLIYYLSDQFKTEIGSDIFWGNDGIFSNYEDNSQIFFKTRYDF